ncbi:hypothetical protein ACQUD4_12585 [Lactococcus lactis]|uniref:Prophage ps3 protein 12 n=1 Tax=Lactococcus lactis TaxID=1358 RepID=A0A9X4NAG9_9LACT|nr:hypothetical protein [Lactococcus lactis]MDG4980366.1 hypothetical protein [Lactococcus lactis]MDT2903792.1 hypothetical protein [Lactococcus lactis]MDT2937586.1 hypothetical protein [Lactococcus lactis]MDT2940706.1 hypothetical protein [Lactococcus lactis]
MSILSIEAEHELTQSVLSHVDKLVKARIEQSREFPYKKKADLKRELSINEAYYKKLVVAGLREVILEEGDKTVWVSKKQLEQLMDQLAE